MAVFDPAVFPAVAFHAALATVLAVAGLAVADFAVVFLAVVLAADPVLAARPPGVPALLVVAVVFLVRAAAAPCVAFRAAPARSAIAPPHAKRARGGRHALRSLASIRNVRTFDKHSKR